MTNKNMSNILREYLLSEQKKNPSLNETILSKKMDIPPTTFNRLINGYSKPNIITMLKLIQFIPELRESLPPEINTLLTVSLKKRKNDEYIGTEIEALLYDKNNFICWSLASLGKGVTKEKIKEILGDSGVNSLEFLEKKQIISKSEELYYKATEKHKKIVLSFQLLKSHVQFLTEQYKLHNIDNNYIHYLISNLSKKGVKEVMKVHLEAHKKVQDIMDTEEYKGNISVFSVSCSDILSDQP